MYCLCLCTAAEKNNSCLLERETESCCDISLILWLTKIIQGVWLGLGWYQSWLIQVMCTLQVGTRPPALTARVVDKEERRKRDCMRRNSLQQWASHNHHVLRQVHSLPGHYSAPCGSQHGELGLCPKFLFRRHWCVCCDLPQVRYCINCHICCQL